MGWRRRVASAAVRGSVPVRGGELMASAPPISPKARAGIARAVHHRRRQLLIDAGRFPPIRRERRMGARRFERPGVVTGPPRVPLPPGQEHCLLRADWLAEVGGARGLHRLPKVDREAWARRVAACRDCSCACVIQEDLYCIPLRVGCTLWQLPITQLAEWGAWSCPRPNPAWRPADWAGETRGGRPVPGDI